MAQPQGFPNLDTPIVDANSGLLSIIWFRFFIALWQRSGGTAGNNSANFNYPDTDGTAGQVLTSAGPTKASVWTTLATKLSQFVNDTGFITADALVGLSTPESTNQQIANFSVANASNQIPPPDTTSGSIGLSSKTARADHSHPREISPNFAGDVTASRFLLHAGVSWTAGTGAPTSPAPNASLYSRTDGITGQRLYVSNGAGWEAIG